MINYGCGIYLDSLNYEQSVTARLNRNNYRIRKWTRQNDVLSEADQLKWFESLSSDKTVKMYSIMSFNDKFMGVCGLTHIDLLNCNAEFSLYINPDCQRQGYGEKALKTLISHGFNTYNLKLIWGETFDKNPAAQMFKDIGFVHEGTFRSAYYRDGSFIDSHRYSILHEEWLVNGQFKDNRKQL